MMFKRHFWKRHYINLALYYSMFALIGLLWGNITMLLLIACSANLIWNYSFQYRLSHWLWSRSTLIPPQGRGSWQHIFNGIYLLQQRHRSRCKDLIDLVRRFREGVEALPDAAVVFKINGSIIWCNKLSRELLGFRWPEDAGQKIGNLIRLPAFHQYLAGQNYQQPLEVTLDAHKHKVLEFRIMPYSNNQCILIVRDVTQSHKLEALRKQFIANISHELRTPLTVLKGYLEIYGQCRQQEKSTPPVREILLEQTNRMDNLVNQLLTLSHIESAPTQKHSAIIQVSKLIEMCVIEAKAISAENHHQFSVDIEPQLNIYGDRHQFKSAICNLINNAVHYTPANKKIQISWQKHAKGAIFSVKDQGIGIPEKHLAHLTERFYRVDEARSRATGGAGLGLAIVKHALNRHGAKLHIKSQVNKGSCFYFIIPYHLVVIEKEQVSLPKSLTTS